jgi:signal transduction histidine kinase/CheY-like chemotaxis protein
MNVFAGPIPKVDPRCAEDELPALFAAQGLRVAIPVISASLFMAWLASARAPGWLMVGWVSAVVAVMLLRWFFHQIAARAPNIPIMYRLNALAGASALSGVVQGQSVLFWPYMDDAARVVQSMFVLGMCAGSVATQFGYVRIVVAYLVPALLPMAMVWAQALAAPGESWLKGASGVMLLLVAMYGAVLAVLARDTFKLFRESFDARQKLKRALETAEAANRAKTRFLASASHDLRQPMHTLSLFSAALAMRPLDPVTRDITVQMNMALHALSTQLDALLDISKLDAGIVQVNPRNFPLGPFLSRLGEEFQPIAQRKGLTLEVSQPTQGFCYTDPLLLERVLRNLLDNAIKYTDSGHVTLTAERRDSHFELCVCDTGQGIPQAEQESVFEEFYQIGNPQRDRSLGLGLGLSIVRRLADLLQITVTMRSVTREGTAFTLQLNAGFEPDEPVQADSSTLPSIRGLRVLVIDDEEAVREGMRSVFEALGCEVRLAAGSDEAERLIRQGPVDVVLADFRLHGADDGLAAVRKLRAIQPGLAALLVSGDTAPARLREAHAAGLRLLHKPANVDLLTRAIREEMDRESDISVPS